MMRPTNREDLISRLRACGASAKAQDRRELSQLFLSAAAEIEACEGRYARLKVKVIALQRAAVVATDAQQDLAPVGCPSHDALWPELVAAAMMSSKP